MLDAATGGPESGLGRYDDYSTKHAAEEADNVFRVYARTKHYTKQERLPANLPHFGRQLDKLLVFKYMFLQQWLQDVVGLTLMSLSMSRC